MSEVSELSPLCQFLIENVAMEGVQVTQAEDGSVQVDVPDVNEDASLFELDREEVRRFYTLASHAGELSLRVKVGSVGPVEFKFFHVTGLKLPEDYVEYDFLVDLGNRLVGQMNIQDPSGSLASAEAVRTSFPKRGQFSD